MYYFYVEIEYVATSFSPTRTDLALTLLREPLPLSAAYSLPTSPHTPRTGTELLVLFSLASFSPKWWHPMPFPPRALRHKYLIPSSHVSLTNPQVKMVIHKLSANLMAISCLWGHSKGHISLLQDTAIYLACKGETFNIPKIEPPAYPVIPAGATIAKRKELCATNAAACKAWNTYKMVLTITRNQFAVAINNVYYAFLTTPPKVSTSSISTPLSCTFSPPMPRSANLIWMTT